MQFRQLLIRVMLWSLGLTAAAGAAAALFSAGDVGWRIVGTGVITAVAAGLMVPFSSLADRPQGRREGLLGMALVVFEFVGALGLIWGAFDAWGGWDVGVKVAATMAFVGMTALPAILFLRFAALPPSRHAGRVGVALSAAVFVLTMLGTWAPDGFADEEKFFGTAAAVAGLGILAVASLAGAGAAPRRSWRWAGVAAAAVATAIAVYAIWADVRSDSGFFAVIVSVAAVVAHANVCLFVPLTPSQRWVRVVTIAAAVATAALVDVIVVADGSLPFVQNLAAAAGIVASCGSLALLVLARLNRHLDLAPVLSEVREVTLVCPGCRRRQALNVGDSACATCGLRFHIRVEEPRCPTCGYLLYMLQSDRCPECGTPVRGAAPPAPPGPAPAAAPQG